MAQPGYLLKHNNVNYAKLERQQDLPAPVFAPPPEYLPQDGHPIINQPSGNAHVESGLMNIPQRIPNCPPGLEYLTTIDQLLVHQKVEMLEVLTGFETENRFTIKNSIGQKIYYAVEDSDCLARNCCGPARPFEMKILDNYQNTVMHLHRPLKCFPCCLNYIEISAPPGQLLGRVQQEWSFFKPSYTVRNVADEIVLRIEGPVCPMSGCGDVNFKVKSADGQYRVGKISKQWSGLLREMFTDADHFGITFPMDLDVKMKAVLLGACFLIDIMFFEDTQQNGLIACLV